MSSFFLFAACSYSLTLYWTPYYDGQYSVIVRRQLAWYTTGYNMEAYLPGLNIDMSPVFLS